MKLTQPWVGYLDRSYEQIKASVLRRLVINNPEISDHSESNLLIIVLSFFSGIAEGIHLYIDNMAREYFMPTARKLESVIALSKLIDYNVKARWYSSVDLIFTLTDQNGIPSTFDGGNILIPKGTVIQSNNGINVQTLYDTYLVAGNTSVNVTAAQYDENFNVDLGTTTGAANQLVLLPDEYVNNSLTLFIDDEFWTIVSSEALLGPNSKSFVTVIDEDGKAYAKFGDGINGLVPAPGKDILGNYKTTEGSLGNLPPDSFNNMIGNIQLPDNSLKISISHSQYSSGGTDFEGIENIRRYAPLSLRTLERMVTYQDYIDVTELQPGVGTAAVQYCCGKYVDIYIVPASKGIATQALLASVKDSLECKKMITTQISIKPSGLSRVWIQGKIYSRPLYSPTQTLIDAITALDDDFGFNAATINGQVIVSDIIASLEAVKSVDRVDLSQIRIEPYVRPSDNNTTPLQIHFNTLPKGTQKVGYRIIFSSGSFQVYKGQYLISVVPVGQAFSDNTTTFTLGSGSYVNGQSWEFTAYPSYPEIFPASLIQIDDYTLPIVDVGPAVDDTVARTIYGDIQVIAQTIKTSCLPPC